MKQLMIVAAMAVLATTLITNDAEAGAWSQPKGQCYAKLWTVALVGSAGFDTEGGTFDTDSYVDVSLNHYVECGVADQWTFIATGRGLGWASYDGLSTMYSGRNSFAMRRGFLNGPLRLAVEVEYGYQGLVGTEDLARRSDVEWQYAAAVESHTGRVGGSIGYGTSWGWLTADLGLRGFTNASLSPALVGMLQVGYKITNGLMVDLHLPYQLLFEDIETNNISGAGNTSYVGLGLGLSWWFKDSIGVSLGFDGVVFAQANAATPAIQLGIEWK